MKARIIIILIAVASVAGIVSVWNSQNIMMFSSVMQTDCYPDELLYDGRCTKIDVPEHIGISWKKVAEHEENFEDRP